MKKRKICKNFIFYCKCLLLKICISKESQFNINFLIFSKIKFYTSLVSLKVHDIIFIAFIFFLFINTHVFVLILLLLSFFFSPLLSIYRNSKTKNFKRKHLKRVNTQMLINLETHLYSEIIYTLRTYICFFFDQNQFTDLFKFSQFSPLSGILFLLIF